MEFGSSIGSCFKAANPPVLISARPKNTNITWRRRSKNFVFRVSAVSYKEFASLLLKKPRRGSFWNLLLSRQPKDSRLGLDLPPSPPSLQLIGYLHLIRSLLIHKSLQKISSKYGTLLHLRIFHIPIVLVSSASVAYEIFTKQDVKISSRGLPTNEGCLFFGSYGFTTAPYGDYWKFMKKLIVTKLLGPKALQRSRDILADETHQFYSNLLDKAKKKETVNIGEEAMKLINNSICKILMGKSCPEDTAAIVRGLVSEMDALTLKVFLAFVLSRPLQKFGISLFKKEFTDVSSRFDEVLERTLVEHEEKREEQGTNLMDILLEAYRDENAEYKITKKHIKSLFVVNAMFLSFINYSRWGIHHLVVLTKKRLLDMLQDFFFAGTDTTAHAIEWTMAEIINNHKVLDRLRGEIDSVVGKTRLIEEEDLPNLPYLQAVVKEGLRLHPPVPLSPREFQQGCTVGGFYVAEKTTLVVNAYAVMRDPDMWEDPEEFKPERFLVSSRSEEDKVREEILKYIPFGSGRRACPGSHLAYIFIGTAIGVMVQCFDWRIIGERVKMDEAVGAVLTMAHPLKTTPVARNQI